MMEQVFQNNSPCSSSRHNNRHITGDKRMRRSIMAVILAALLMLPVAHIAFADALTVQTGQAYYSVGSVVTINGTSPADAVLDLSI